MKITAKDIQKLREATGAGVMSCKEVMTKAKGDFNAALQLLRQKGIALAAKKSSREARQGRIEAYVHLNNKIGVLVEVSCETDFVAKCEDFKKLSRDLAMQIAALNPLYLKKEDMPKAVIKEHKQRLEDFYKESCLLEQAFIKDHTKTVKDYLTEVIAKIGENIIVRRFVRFQLGEEN